MHIILMSDRLGRTISFRLDRRLGLALAGVLLAALAWSGYLGFHFGRGDSAATVLLSGSQSPSVDQLALRVGELQARLSRITDVGERVAKKVGIPVPDPKSAVPAGQGGPNLPIEATPMSQVEMARVLDDLASQFDHEADRLTILDSELLIRQARQGSLPMDRPVDDAGYITSPFGMRVDPFTGKMSRHEGLDFCDTPGSPIFAAESGVVIAAQATPDYGNMVEIDHGNGLTTRYGHCLALLVKPGDIVKRDQKIALVGSTGRSTGPHCHFEVRKDGVAQNPVPYLAGQL